MPWKTSRPMGESPCQWVIWGKMPDTTVKEPTPRPMAIDSWYGLKRRGAPSVLAGALGLLIAMATLLALSRRGDNPAQASAVMSAIEVADAGGEGGEDLVANGRDLVDDREQLALFENEHLALGVTDNRCGA